MGRSTWWAMSGSGSRARTTAVRMRPVPLALCAAGRTTAAMPSSSHHGTGPITPRTMCSTLWASVSPPYLNLRA